MTDAVKDERPMPGPGAARVVVVFGGMVVAPGIGGRVGATVTRGRVVVDFGLAVVEIAVEVVGDLVVVVVGSGSTTKVVEAVLGVPHSTAGAIDT